MTIETKKNERCLAAPLLAINGGSSSIKFALYEPADPPRRLLAGVLERLGSADAVLRITDGDVKDGGTRQLQSILIDGRDHRHAIDQLLDWLEKHAGGGTLSAVGHRIVHGGARYIASQRVTPAMLAELKRLVPLDPEHLPAEIALVEAFARRFPSLPQVACFDTAFHHNMPRVAQLLPIPRRYQAQGLRRFGFHGISYAYLLEELNRVAGAAAAQGRVILAHLGAGASLAAVHEGKCVDTSMAFTPTAGLVMGKRTGDLDPGLLIHLLRSEALTADQLDNLVNHESGLLGLSETTSDMRDLLARETSDPRAADAANLFCYQAKKWIGAYAAALGGLDTLVFSGGIGEHAAAIRERISDGLEFLGIRLDAASNLANATVISADGSRVTVRVIPTDEEAMLARETRRVLAG
jgi:acetate kinase